MARLVTTLAMILVLSGCSVKAVPRPDAVGEINPADGSITQVKKGVAITARVQDMQVAPYRIADNITSFYLIVENRRDAVLDLPLDSFVLLDDRDNQYRPITPGELQEIVSRDSSYLIPYPYVGFYYLQDQEKFAQFNTFTSDRPYYAENHPQEMYVAALPAGPVLPGARVSGMVYFVVDLATKDSFSLRTYLPGTPPSAEADFSFPFLIEK